MQITSAVCGLANRDRIINHDVNIAYPTTARLSSFSFHSIFIL